MLFIALVWIKRLKCGWDCLILVRCANGSGLCDGAGDGLNFRCHFAVDLFDLYDGRKSFSDVRRDYCCILEIVELQTTIHRTMLLLGLMGSALH